MTINGFYLVVDRRTNRCHVLTPEQLSCLLDNYNPDDWIV